ncbi:MAG TPA: EAL domain-containing protein [Ideonella sp.]|nr:EAL domain-containing protein [Ideonella sp.]
MSVVVQQSEPKKATARRRGLRTYLIALILVAVLPAVGAAGMSVWRAATAYRDASATRLLDTARTLARSVENELEGSAAILTTLATAPGPVRLDPGSATDDHKPAGKARGKSAASPAHQPDRGEKSDELPIWLDRLGGRLQGNIQLHTVSDLRAQAARSLPDGMLETALRDHRPTLSNLFVDHASQMPRVALAVPRSTAGAPPGQVLALVVPPQQLVRTLQTSPSQHSSLLVAVTDGTGHVVARTHEPERFVGRPVPDWAKLQALQADSGIFEAITTDGKPVIFGFQKLRGTPGWVVVAGESLELFNARWQQPLMAVAGGGTLALALALGLAAWLARTVLRPVQALAEHAQRLASDEGEDGRAPPPVAPSTIEEFESLRRSLATSEAVLRSRAAALAAGQRRYRRLAEAGALVLWRGDAACAVVAATGWQELTGQPNEDASGARWVRLVHPADQPQLIELREQLAAGGRLIDLECRVRTAQGLWRWVRMRGAPVADARGRIEEWVGVVEDIDERRQAQARIAHLAHHDAMTGLVNRMQFRECLDAAILRAGRGEQGAVLCLDLDRFKEVNDTLGHSVGDKLLCMVADRLRALVRETDTVARLGGDEFAIQQSNVNQPADAMQLAVRVVAELSAPYEINGEQAVIGASVGIVMVDGRDIDADGLLQNADLALYRAKEEGRGRCSFFDPNMNARMQARREMELSLRRAVIDQEFELHYQPLMDVRSLAVNGFEALLRWRRPGGGLLMPEAFLARAEDLGVIVPIGEWVLCEACAQATTWPAGLRVSVNLSAAQLRHRGLFAAVQRALAASGLPASSLELEITERALLERSDEILETLHRLRGLGVQITMGDFGTGHWSLGLLRSFPFNKVKIDRSFVRDLGLRKDGDAIVRGVSSLCDSLGLATSAEGVETAAQLQLLSAELCAEAQGFLFSEALPAVEIPALLATLQALAAARGRPSGIRA